MTGAEMSESLASIILAVVMAVCGVVLTIVGLKMRHGTLKPNSFAGVRSPGAFRSEEDWYRIQARCAFSTLLMGGVGFDSALLFIAQAILSDIVSILVPLAIATVQALLGLVYMSYTAANASRQKEHHGESRGISDVHYSN
ncbi:hypothetical protein DRB06_11175 [Actinomyces sp. Z5]|uniref:SdpI family protein n=1 Tax=Actinomyces sp. Z5 TaxID=2250216 RepID=UPI000DCEC4EE|nr:SdpI family protein [Actinomyces sp. Z5]RAX19784.1 hypothetical protein DRB06_11175 [Actinomyces sp. Z5]